MIERRLVGRRFIDFHPEVEHPLYPNELERRVARRRDGDREGTPRSADVLFPGRRRRPPVLWNGIARCNICGSELRRARNLSSQNRKYFIVEFLGGARAQTACNCDDNRPVIEWLAQSGTE